VTITLVGDVVYNADAATNFTAENGGANISGDDDFVQGTGAVGDKMSNTTEVLASNALLGGASGVYNFAVGGADEGKHFIGWINTKTPIDATSGIQTYFKNAAGHLGYWNNMPTYFYKGGFTTRVINPARAFDGVTTWTVGGNPAQLDDVSIMGFRFTTVTSIMGSFNNLQVDRATVGFGLRADAGTSGTPNTFDSFKVDDQDTNFYGWWSGVGKSYGAKGRAYIGPESGDVASWFVDSAFSVVFQDEFVSATFYDIRMRGGNTTVTWSLASIAAAVPGNSRWSLTVDSGLGATTGGFTDNSGVWSGSNIISLNSKTTLLGTTLINGNSLVQGGATLTGIVVASANTAAGVGYVTSANPTLITDSRFTYSAGHAIVLTTPGTYTFSGNKFTNYLGTPGSNGTASSGSTGAAIYNNSGGLVTLNISGGGDVPSIRNGAGATTVVNATVNLTLSANVSLVGAEVRIYDDDNSPAGSYGTELAGTESNAGSTFVYSGSSGNDIVVQVMKDGFEEFVQAVTMPASAQTLNMTLKADTNT